MAVAISDLRSTDDAFTEWAPVAQAAARAGVTPAAVRRAGRSGAVPMRQETVGRRTLAVVRVADVVAALGTTEARAEEAFRRAEEALDRVARAEELTRFFRDQLAALHQANEDLQREVTRLGQEQFRLRANTAYGDDARAAKGARRRAWRRRASLT